MFIEIQNVTLGMASIYHATYRKWLHRTPTKT